MHAYHQFVLDVFPVLVRRLTLANLAANIGIVVTGGGVRLTGSGLGCPTWPRCTEDSYTVTEAMGINGVIEYGNRLLSLVVAVVAIATVVAVWRLTPVRGNLRRLAIGVALLVAVQAVVGGITVHTDLSPYLVGPHFLVSMVIIAVAYRLWRGCYPPAAATPPRLRVLTWTITAASAIVLIIGVLVTGSGPHSGDEKAVRLGLNPEMISQLHADVVLLLIGLTLAAWLTLRALEAREAARAALILLGIELAQGAIGFVQYFTGLPEILVAAHMAGACVVWVATLALLSTTLGSPTAPAPAGTPIDTASSDAPQTPAVPEIVTVR
jgi:cytochrome c oxidase assembly protein subunit 15